MRFTILLLATAQAIRLRQENEDICEHMTAEDCAELPSMNDFMGGDEGKGSQGGFGTGSQ